MSFFKRKSSGAEWPGGPMKLASVELRDGQQSLLATRMKTEDMLPIISKMDQVGYDCMEVWGGATFDSCIRFLHEDPWERVRLFKRAAPRTPLRMLLRGQNLLGYRQYADDVVEKFVFASANAGIDIFLIFDGLNDTRNTQAALKAVRKTGRRAEANILYTLSPVHSIEKYVEIAKEYEAMGMQAIHLEDMAGMVDPISVYKCIRALKENVDVPVHFQAHSTGGMAPVAYWEAARAGVDVLDVDVSALALGTSHPAIEPLVVELRGTPRDTGLDLGLISEINDYFKQMRVKYKEFESTFTGVDISVLRHQIPGGMLSNLESQLKQMDVLNRIDEVLAEVAVVRRDLGYPPLGTPFSQIVGAQATINVLAGQRYKMLPKETKLYLSGRYGKAPGEVNPDLVKQVLGNEQPITCRPADLIAPEYEKLREEIADLARSDEDVLTYALFPAVARDFLKGKYGLQ